MVNLVNVVNPIYRPMAKIFGPSSIARAKARIHLGQMLLQGFANEFGGRPFLEAIPLSSSMRSMLRCQSFIASQIWNRNMVVPTHLFGSLQSPMNSCFLLVKSTFFVADLYLLLKELNL